MKRIRAFATQDLIGIFLIVLIFLFFISFMKKKREEKFFVNNQKAFSRDIQSQKNISMQDLFELTVRTNLSRDDNGNHYLELRYRLQNIGDRDIVIDRKATEVKGLRFEIKDRLGKKIPLSANKSRSNQHGPEVKSVVSLASGESFSGAIRVYPEDYPDYVAGEYKAQAYLTVYGKPDEARKEKVLCKLVSREHAFFIPKIPQQE